MSEGLPITCGIPPRGRRRALWDRSHTCRSRVSRPWHRRGLLMAPGRCSRAMVCLRRWVHHLLLGLMYRPSSRRYRHTGGMNKRVISGGAEHALTHVGRVAQNRTSGYLTWHTTDCAPVPRQVEGHRVRRLIVIGG